MIFQFFRSYILPPFVFYFSYSWIMVRFLINTTFLGASSVLSVNNPVIIRGWQQPTNCLSVFERSMGLTFKGLNHSQF